MDEAIFYRQVILTRVNTLVNVPPEAKNLPIFSIFTRTLSSSAPEGMLFPFRPSLHGACSCWTFGLTEFDYCTEWGS